SQILIVSGAMMLERVTKGRVHSAAFVALMFLYCLPFTWGFVNFEFGLGAALCGIAVYLRVQDKAWPVRFAVNAGFVVLLFAAHFFALGIYGATIGIHELWRAQERKSAPVETALRLVVVAIPALALLAATEAGGGAIGGEGTAWFFEFKPIWLFRIMNGYNLTVSAVSVCALIGFIYIAARRGILKFAPGGLWLALGFAALYVAIPSRLVGTSFVDFRMIVAGAFIMPAFCVLTLPDRNWMRIALVGTACITLANLAVVTTVWLSYRADYAAMIASFAKIDKGARVLTGTSGNGDDPPFNDLTQYPFYYAPVLAVHYADAFAPNLFTAVGKQPVVARASIAHLDTPHGGPVPMTILSALAAGKTADIVPRYLRNWTVDFDYLYVLGPPAGNPLPALLEERERSSRFMLYKIRKP
ncbi:MAG: hypothetical protein ABI830_03005, partial [Pseudolabrys sp.]